MKTTSKLTQEQIILLCELVKQKQLTTKELKQFNTILNKCDVCYEQAYIEQLDMTIIICNGYFNSEEVFTTISGFYYGEPDTKYLEQFKNDLIAIYLGKWR